MQVVDEIQTLLGCFSFPIHQFNPLTVGSLEELKKKFKKNSNQLQLNIYTKSEIHSSSQQLYIMDSIIVDKQCGRVLCKGTDHNT